MKYSFHKSRRPAALVLTILLLSCCLSVSALDATNPALYSDAYHFTQEDFAKSVSSELTGIYVSQVPSAAIAQIYYGDRVLCPGDVLPSSVLGELTLQPVSRNDQTAAIVYLPSNDDRVLLR